MTRYAITLLILIWLLPAGAFAQLPCDFNNNGVWDTADLVRIINWSSGGLQDTLPEYWLTGDCDCDKLHLTIADIYSLVHVMIYGGYLEQGRQRFDHSELIEIPDIYTTPGSDVIIPVYISSQLDLVGLQFYLRYDADYVEIMKFNFADSFPFGADSAGFIFKGGLSVFTVNMPDELDFEEPVGFLRVNIRPETPPGTEIALEFSDDPHIAMYTGFVALNDFDDSDSNIAHFFIHPEKIDGVIHVVARLNPDVPDNAPDSFDLRAAPNPFNSSTSFSFDLEKRSGIQVDIYDILGRRVARLADDFINAGSHNIVWNGDGLPSGVYFCVLTVDGFSVSQRVTMLK